MGQTSWPLKLSQLEPLSFKVRQHVQQKLYLQYKVHSILYKTVGARATVFVQTTTLYILRHKNVSLLQSVFTSIFYPYLFTNSSITLTLPSSIPHHFFTFLFLRTTIPTIYTKSVFPILAIYLILVLSRDQGARTSCEDWHCFDLSIFP